jgi:hypothetical protein
MKTATASSTAPAPINTQAHPGMPLLDPLPFVDVVGLTATVVVWLSIVVVLPGSVFVSVLVTVSVRAGAVMVLAGSVTVFVSVVVVSATSFPVTWLEPQAHSNDTTAMRPTAVPTLRAAARVARYAGAPTPQSMAR